MYLCTYCWRPFDPRAAVFRCANPVTNAQSTLYCQGRARDAIYEGTHGNVNAGLLGRVFDPPKGTLPTFVSKARCEMCNTETEIHICPHCHDELEKGFESKHMEDQNIITIIGGRGTGKSHYIATLIDTLNKLSTTTPKVHLNGAFLPVAESAKRWQDLYYNPLFGVGPQGKQLALLPTPDSLAQPEFLKPLAYQLNRTERPLRNIDLYFFDAPGENFDSVNQIRTYVQQLHFSRAVIFMLDPAQIPGIHLKRKGTALTQAASDGAAVLLTRIKNELGNKHIEIPVAFTLTKLDLILDQFDISSPMRYGINYTYGFDLRELELVHMEMQSYLQRFAPDILQTIAGFSNNYHYFAVSCLGCPPKSTGELMYSPACFRVEEPLFWILRQLKFL
jgi:hypothetical protein